MKFKAIILLFTVFYLCSSERVQGQTLEPITCPFALPAGVIEGQMLECDYLIVPEDRGDPNGRRLYLVVAIFRHPDGASEPDPIVFLNGGPGGSALERIQYSFPSVYRPLFAANRDIIILEQRGVGLSQPALDCPDFDELILDFLDGQLNGRPLSGPEATDLVLSTLKACEQRLGAVARLSAFNTVTNAADVNDLRVALGVDRVNLWGGSYGSRLALGVLRDFPESVRSVVLEAVYPPDVDLYVETPANMERAFNHLFQACAADEACNNAYPNLRTVFYQTVDRLNQAPVAIEVTNPFNRRTYDVMVSGASLLGSLFNYLYAMELIRWLPRIIYDVSEGNFDLMTDIEGSFLAQLGILSRGMHFSVQCHEEIPFSSVDRLSTELAKYPHLAEVFEGGMLGKMTYRICEDWDSGRAAAKENRPVQSAIPTLLMSGDYDPITPPRWAQHAAGTLTNSYSFLYHGTGHGSSAHPCPRSMMVAFLNRPGTVPDSTCMTSMGVRFALPTEPLPLTMGLRYHLHNPW